jgi:hypothetical protein
LDKHGNTEARDLTQRWVDTWIAAGEALAEVKRRELQHLDTQKAIALLCGPADYTKEPRAPKPYSGLVEQQYWFRKAAGLD